MLQTAYQKLKLILQIKRHDLLILLNNFEENNENFNSDSDKD